MLASWDPKGITMGSKDQTQQPIKPLGRILQLSTTKTAINRGMDHANNRTNTPKLPNFSSRVHFTCMESMEKSGPQRPSPKLALNRYLYGSINQRG
jgi:hypothetical protein